MTFGQIWDRLRDLKIKCKTIEEEREFPNTEVRVFFDFPLVVGSGTKGYKISKITKDGIIIRNEDVERPKGHL